VKLNGGPAELAVYGLIAGAVWLGWEMVKVPIADRAPPAIALRISPTSEEALRRASEIELSEGRFENAEALATDSLSRAPFNARSLRVLGLATAKKGQLGKADAMLTLAGNWSLRDDPTHAWLVERRLREGNYSSAFAHADTLARRREDSYAAIFNLYTTAALADPRALKPLSETVGLRPPWRGPFIEYLLKRKGGDPVAFALAVALAKKDGAFSDLELRALYLNWLGERRLPAMHLLRRELGKPGPEGLQDGEFSVQPDEALLPFGWNILTQKGFFSSLVEDDLRDNDTALRVEYDGYSTGVAVEQLLMLASGRHRLTGQYRIEVSPPESRLAWTVRCLEDSKVIARSSVPVASSEISNWTRFRVEFTVPNTSCSTQMLQLQASPLDRRDSTVAWFDKFDIEQAQ
jgi:hypothetical protein